MTVTVGFSWSMESTNSAEVNDISFPNFGLQLNNLVSTWHLSNDVNQGASNEAILFNMVAEFFFLRQSTNDSFLLIVQKKIIIPICYYSIWNIYFF